MTDTRNAMEELGEESCWAMLAAAEVARLAVVVDGAPEILPVNHAVDGRRVLLRTAAGTKLFAALGRHVAVEVDGLDRGQAWSVVAKGVAEEVLDDAGKAVADERLEPWLDSEKRHVVGIDVFAISGRRFERLRKR